MTHLNYAGDVTPREAWEALLNDADAVLVDCRTHAEWSYVGVPELSETGRQASLIEWQSFPDGERNANFLAEVSTAIVGKDKKILLLCRSGVRSVHAAIALSEAGFSRCFNILDGFEGQLDANSHRGAEKSGWKASGLPWRQ